MNMKDPVQYTIYVSLIAQFLALFLGAIALLFPLGSEDMVLKDVLALETVVQLVEAIFYVWFSYVFISGIDFAMFRYYDWVITTPIMLFSTIVYFEYNTLKELGMSKGFRIRDFLADEKHRNNLIKIVIYNFLMLLFGYLNEIGMISIYTSTIFGFLFFGLNFYLIYKEYARQNSKNMNLFYFLLFIWGLYGVAAVYPNTIKNTSYNLLDIVAKNFYGLFVAYEIYRLRSRI